MDEIWYLIIYHDLKRKYNPDVIIANGENAAAGRGITKAIFDDLLRAGVDVVTMGNHTWDQKEIYDFIDDTDYLNPSSKLFR